MDFPSVLRSISLEDYHRDRKSQPQLQPPLSGTLVDKDRCPERGPGIQVQNTALRTQSEGPQEGVTGVFRGQSAFSLK